MPSLDMVASLILPLAATCPVRRLVLRPPGVELLLHGLGQLGEAAGGAPLGAADDERDLRRLGVRAQGACMGRGWFSWRTIREDLECFLGLSSDISDFTV